MTERHLQVNSSVNPIKKVVAYWPLLVFIFVAGGFYYSTTSATSINTQNIQAANAEIAHVEQRQQNDELQQADTNTKILTQLSQIQSDIQWIKLRLK